MKDSYNYIRELARSRGLDEDLATAVLHQESRGRSWAVSPKGAKGLMQAMPTTLTDPGFGVQPAADNSVEESARVGVDYLKAMLDRYDGNVNAALAAYNAGPKRADKYGGNVPIRETRDYVAKITKHFKKLKGLEGNTETYANPGQLAKADTLSGGQNYRQLPQRQTSLAELALNAAFPAAQANEFEDANGPNALEFNDPIATDGGVTDPEDAFANLDVWDNQPASDVTVDATDDTTDPFAGLDTWDEVPKVQDSGASIDSQPPKPATVDFSGSYGDVAKQLGYDPEVLRKGGVNVDNPYYAGDVPAESPGRYAGDLGSLAYGFSSSAHSLADLAAMGVDKLVGNMTPEERQASAFENAARDAEYAATRDGSFDPGALIGSLATPVPGGGGATLLSKIGKGALAGGAAGLAYSKADIGSDDYWTQKAMGAGLGVVGGGTAGGVLGAGGYVVNKATNAALGRMSPEATQLQALADESGVKLLTTDALSRGKVNDTIAATMHVLPGVGTAAEKHLQSEQLAARADALAAQAEAGAVSTPYSKYRGFETAAKVPRSQAATSKAIMEDAGADLGKIIGASADLMSTKEASEASKLYNKVRAQATTDNVQTTYPSMLKALDEQITKLETSKFRDDTLINALKIAKNKVQRGSAAGMDDILETRTTINTLLDKAASSQLFIHSGLAVKSLNAVKKGLQEDIAVVTPPRSKLGKLLGQADEYERVVVKGREGAKLTYALDKAKESGDFDEVASLVMRPHLVDRAAKSATLLDEKGRQALLASIIKRGVESSRSNGTGEFSPATMATFLGKNSKAIHTLGGPEYTRQVEGYNRLLQHLNTKAHEQKMTLGSTSVTGLALGSGLYSAAALTTPQFLASAAGMAVLFRTEAGKRLLLASSKTPISSPKFNALVDQLQKQATKAAALQTSQGAQ